MDHYCIAAPPGPIAGLLIALPVSLALWTLFGLVAAILA